MAEAGRAIINPLGGRKTQTTPEPGIRKKDPNQEPGRRREETQMRVNGLINIGKLCWSSHSQRRRVLLTVAARENASW